MGLSLGPPAPSTSRLGTLRGSRIKVSASAIEETTKQPTLTAEDEEKSTTNMSRVEPVSSSLFNSSAAAGGAANLNNNKNQSNSATSGGGGDAYRSRKGPAGGRTTNPLRRLLQNLLILFGFFMWLMSTFNSILDPAKTLYGYYLYTDSDNQEAVWELRVKNVFRIEDALPCKMDEKNFKGCYYELPVYGTGSLAGGSCRSYYPLDKEANQHIGNFFGNCTTKDSQHIWIPSERYKTTQWSVQTSSLSRSCLQLVGEGDVFPCDSYTTMKGRVINYRISRTEASKWCREFGGFYIFDKKTDIQEVLIANISKDGGTLAFTSLALDYRTPVFSLEELLGCSTDIHIGGAATHITTYAWYGDTAAPWTARTTSTARDNNMTWTEDGMNVTISTHHYSEGDLTQIRSWYKDYARVAILLVVFAYRMRSIYFPLYVALAGQNRKLWDWASSRSLGLVIHKRERRDLVILSLLTFETIMSVEDIVMFCQQLIYTGNTAYIIVVLKYMSIARIIWPCALLLRICTLVINIIVSKDYSVDFAEDLFLVTLPVVWTYIPTYVNSRGMDLFQGYNWVGKVVRHYVNSIIKVYTSQMSYVTLYYFMFGWFTICAVGAVALMAVVQTYFMRNGSLLAFMFSGFNRMHLRGAMLQRSEDKLASSQTLCEVLQRCRLAFAKGEAYQITRAKVPGTLLCESMNLAAEGFVMLQYGQHRVLGYVNWFSLQPVTDADGSVAVITKNTVRYEPEVTESVLLSCASQPAILGIPDIY